MNKLFASRIEQAAVFVPERRILLPLFLPKNIEIAFSQGEPNHSLVEEAAATKNCSLGQIAFSNEAWWDDTVLAAQERRNIDRICKFSHVLSGC
jgi:hypothetical protein